MRLIDADALIVELEKDEALFDKEAEKARENSDSCLENYANAMWSRANGIRDAIIEIYDAPTIDAYKPKGEWIDEKEVRPPFDVRIYKCSACGRYADAILASMYKFCPNCGADMRERE